MNYLVKDYRFTNDEAEILIDQAVPTNIRSVLLHGKASYRNVKSDSVGNATILIPYTQVDTEEADITANIILNGKTADRLSTRKTATSTTADKHEVDDIATFIERKFNYLSEIMEKGFHKLAAKFKPIGKYC